MRFLLILVFVVISMCASSQACTTQVYTKSYNLGPPKGQFLFTLPGGGTIFGGRDFYNGNQIGIVKATSDGNVVFNKRIDGLSSSNISAACLTIDRNILIGTRESLILIDTNGMILKSAVTAMSYGDHYVYDIKTDAQGNFYALYEASGGWNQQHVLAKISPDLSTMMWTVTFGTDYSSIYRSIMIDDDKVYAPGGFPSVQGDSTVASVLCFSAIDGSLLKQVTFKLDGYTCFMNTINKTNDGFLLEGFYQPFGTPNLIQNHVIVRLNDLLQPVKASRLSGIFNTDPLRIIPDGQGGFYASGRTAWISFFHCDQQDSVTWSRVIVTSGFGLGAFAMSSTNLYAVEATCWTIIKADLNGFAGGCYEVPQQMGSEPITPVLFNMSMTAAKGSLTIGPAANNVSDKTFSLMQDCKMISSCSSVTIIGPSSVCTNGTPVVFKGRRNVNCRLPVQWKINGSPAKLNVFNDSTISIQFTSGGHYQLIASLPSTCEVITDTLNMDVSVSLQPLLDLGPDAMLCAGNTISLNAHKGYITYTWQDGSIDSVYSVNSPGLYYVTTTDACGGVYKDSITITAAPPIPFVVGPDRTKCNGDTVRFSAPSGFMNYSWSPAYNISSASTPDVTVNPSVDTTYFVKAEKTPGCFAYDTVHVTVHHSPAIDLGADQSFCSGDSVVLDAGNGFASYLWNGSNGAQYKTAYLAGRYDVIGITLDGCRSYDTVFISNVWPLPQVKLDHNPSLCEGLTRKLNPGSFSSYLWQDGSSGSTFMATSVGTYYVLVTDNHNCIGSDTTAITQILPLPKGFLPPDTALCSYSKLNIKSSQNYSSYLWDNGSKTTNITIDKPGAYWLEVTDGNSCTGRDTIMVTPKQCMTGVYVPNAFSPNKDYKNDVFRALVFGVAKKFELSVYNRWGQMVFYTTDINKGWNGKVGGVDQQPDVFVWTCRYQLEGDQERFDKGTVTIIR